MMMMMSGSQISHHPLLRVRSVFRSSSNRTFFQGSRPSASPQTKAAGPSKTTIPTNPPPKKRALVDLSLIGIGVLSIGATLIWLKSNQQRSREANDLDSSHYSDRNQFEIPIASHTGSPGGKKILTMLSTEEVDRLLKKYETTFLVDRPGNPVYRYDTNHVASNSPIEDDSICTLMSRDQLLRGSKSANLLDNPMSSNDMLFFGVFDGHAGWQTSRLLVDRLVPWVNRELNTMFCSDPYYATSYLANRLMSDGNHGSDQNYQKLESTRGTMGKIWDFVTWKQNQSRIFIDNLDEDDRMVKLAIQNAFIKLDEEIVSRPVKLLISHEAQMKNGNAQALQRTYGAEVTPQQTESLQALLPALSGSCAILAYIDCLRSKVHVACTGDSRGVMGVWDPKANDGRGKWRAQLLSEDQEGLNPNEVQRIQSEHPESEKDNVIKRGRVLGGLQPTRAFGDARYKWPVGISTRLYEAFHPMGTPRRDPPDYLTPPYVTAQPEVSSTHLPSSTDTDKPAFIVLATDGLWDRLETSEVVGLVGTWLEMNIPSSDQIRAQAKVITRDLVAGPERVEVISPSSTDRKNAHDPSSSYQSNSSSGQKYFTFEDSNVATHLIRNALGGASREKVGALLSIPAPHSRRYRDDITVTVVFLDPQKNEDRTMKLSLETVQGDGITPLQKTELVGISKL